MAIRNQELIDRLQQLEDKLTALGELQPNLQTLQDAATLKVNADALVVSATDAKARVDELVISAEKAKADAEEATKKSMSATKAVDDVNGIILEKLGVVNAETLARDFGSQATTLGTSAGKWWIRLNWYSLALFAAALGVVYWESRTTKSFGSAAFVLKAAVLSPIAYLVYSASRQHRLETTLKHQYSFKAAVASSLESYRLLLSENIPTGADGTKSETGQNELNTFLEARITDLFREPLENRFRVEEDDAMDALIVGYQGKMSKMARRFLTLPKANE